MDLHSLFTRVSFAICVSIATLTESANAPCQTPGQSSASLPTFEVSSVKQANPEATISMNRYGNQFTASNASLEMLVLWAYDIKADRLFGKPKWLDSARYDVIAKASEEKPTKAVLQQMMQSLLAERFKLAIHFETRQLPMYAMVVSKDGPKVSLDKASASLTPVANPFNMTSSGRLTGTKVSSAMLSKALSDQLGRAVEDKTGLKGVFDFTLEWTPDAELSDGNSGDPKSGASIFTALQEQLGFKLEPRKGPVQVLVIDHMEKQPTEN